MAVATDIISGFGHAVDELCEADPSTLADGETLVELDRRIEQLKAVRARATARFDADGGWQPSGAQTMAAWLAGKEHLPMPTARRRVTLGRALRHLAETERAWLAGEIGEAQVALLAKARYPETEAFFARDEALLVSQAGKLRYSHFCRALARWLRQADPEGEERRAREVYDGRRVHLSKSWRGAFFLDGVMDPIGGTIFERELRRIEERLFDEDWAEAKARLGQAGVCVSRLRRTHAQRRHDALVEMARRSGAVVPGARLPEPLFNVFLGLEEFKGLCELSNGMPVTPGSLLPWLSEAWIERAVFDGPSRVIDVGVKRRLFQGATRRAVQLRDRECFHEFCELPAEDCEVDHIEPHSAGGLTVQANGRSACGVHNRGRHRRP